jgi:hypothetical protein
MVTMTVPIGLPKERYRIVIVLGRQRITCHATLPSENCGAGGFHCDERVRVMPWCSTQAGLPESYSLQFDAYPQMVSATIYRGEKRIAAGHCSDVPGEPPLRPGLSPRRPERGPGSTVKRKVVTTARPLTQHRDPLAVARIGELAIPASAHKGIAASLIGQSQIREIVGTTVARSVLSSLASLMFGTAPMSREEFLAAGSATSREFGSAFAASPPCTKVSYFPLKLMVARHGRRRQLHEAMARLRCAQCGGRPTTIAITDHPNDGELGGEHATWKLGL